MTKPDEIRERILGHIAAEMRGITLRPRVSDVDKSALERAIVVSMQHAIGKVLSEDSMELAESSILVNIRLVDNLGAGGNFVEIVQATDNHLVKTNASITIADILLCLLYSTLGAHLQG